MLPGFDRLENIVWKGKNTGHQHLLLFQQYFQKASVLESLKVEIVWQRPNAGNQENVWKRLNLYQNIKILILFCSYFSVSTIW